MKVQLIRDLMTKTGCSFSECKRAIEVCKTLELSERFLRTRSSGVSFRKIVGHESRPFNDEDFLMLVRKSKTVVRDPS